MREIKFRGKVRKTEFFETVNDTYPINKDYWVYGWLVKDADGKTFILPADETHVDDKDNKLYFDGVPIIPEVDPETVGQYTGQKDENGREIYEGDIVKWANGYMPPNAGVVTYWENGCQFACVMDYGAFNLVKKYAAGGHLSEYKHNTFIVIGNIHDNPELLKE
jgi:uncharacterized phage protein (TIGR01671 family)